jgi:hypothetical protein
VEQTRQFPQTHSSLQQIQLIPARISNQLWEQEIQVEETALAVTTPATNQTSVTMQVPNDHMIASEAI